jgi:hypothetical protein
VLSRWHAVRPLRLAVVRTHHLTGAIYTTKHVDPGPTVDRRESVPFPAGRQGAVEEGVRAAPGRELGLGASAGVQAGEEKRDENHAPCTHFDRRAWF